MAAIIDSVQSAEATQILHTGFSVAFGLGWLHRINGRGNSNPACRDLQLPLVLGGFIGSMAESTKFLLAGIFSCLYSD